MVLARFFETVAVCAPLLLQVAHAQQLQPAPSRNTHAIPGCRVTFLLGIASLTVEAELLDYSMVSPSHGRKECPSQPVEVDSVYLTSAVLGVLKIKDLGHRGYHPDWLLHIRPSPVFQNEPQTFPAPASRVRGQPVEASIEMQKFGRGRSYVIHYRTSDETMAGTSKISCDDDPENRICSGALRFAGLMLNYSISQDQFPATHEVSTDPSTESGAILQFDQRLREWLIDLERPR
jgi:hypothetical protein